MTDHVQPGQPSATRDEPANASGAVDALPVAGEPLSFACPRGQSAVNEDFYGPCASCRESLRLAYESVSRDVVAEAYEPKMNVTPNAVASKE